MPTIEELSHQVDDATAAYVLATQSCFEDLKQVAAQLAGWLVLAAAGSKEAAPDHPALRRAREMFRESCDALGHVRPTERARRHYDHLSRASGALGLALKQTGARLEVDRVLVPLRAGYAEIEHAADALPGFEKISYARACCGGMR